MMNPSILLFCCLAVSGHGAIGACCVSTIFQLMSQVRGIPRLVFMAAGDNLQLLRSYTVLVCVCKICIYIYICVFMQLYTHCIIYLMDDKSNLLKSYATYVFDM